MNIKQFIGWAFALAGLAAAIGSMATVDWVSNCSDDGNGGTDCEYFGLRRYRFTHTDANGNTNTDSGDLHSDDQGKRYYDAGTKVLEAGIPALFCMALGPVLYCLYASGKVKSTGMLVAGLAVSMASVVLVVLAMLLYAHQFFVSYCFTMYFVGALLFLTATTATVVAIFSDQINKPKVAFGIVSSLIGVALVCASLALVNWFHLSNSDVGVSPDQNNGVTFDVYIGIRNYKVEAHANGFDFEDDGTLKHLKDTLEAATNGTLPPVLGDLLNGLIDAGNLALGFGIVGLFFAFLGLLFSIALIAGAEGKVIGAAVSSNVLAALFVLIGTMTWAHKIHVGYSFIVWTLSGFLVLVGVAFFVAGVSVAGADGKVALASDDTTGTGHTLMRDTA